MGKYPQPQTHVFYRKMDFRLQLFSHSPGMQLGDRPSKVTTGRIVPLFLGDPSPSLTFINWKNDMEKLA